MSLAKRWVVYLHENRVNGKRYIGITCQKPERRWQNGRGYRGNDHFYRAIQKHGWHSFRHEILYTDLPKDEAERLEIKLIAEYGTLDPEKGYNLDPGGCVRSPTPETRRKLSESCRGRVFSPETLAKMSAAKKGKPSNRKGQKLSLETRQKISAANRNRANVSRSPSTRRSPSARRIAVLCVETGERFDSMAVAEQAKNVRSNKISMCCAGKQKTAGGYHWEYYNDTPIFDT